MNETIRESLSKAQACVNSLKKTNTLYIYVGLIASVLATLIAGITAFNGPVAGQGPGAWKWTCGIVAVFTATATVFTGLQKQLSISERLAKATECSGKIRGILFELERSDISAERKNEVLNEYKKIVELYSEFLN